MTPTGSRGTPPDVTWCPFNSTLQGGSPIEGVWVPLTWAAANLGCAMAWEEKLRCTDWILAHFTVFSVPFNGSHFREPEASILGLSCYVTSLLRKLVVFFTVVGFWETCVTSSIFYFAHRSSCVILFESHNIL